MSNQWNGSELGELAKVVIRQLNFQSLKFDVVMVGSMFEGGQLLIDPMRETIQQLAPGGASGAIERAARCRRAADRYASRQPAANS